MQLNYKVYGEGRPMIILHGLFGSSDNWMSIAKKIAERGYQVFLPDQRNHGDSPWSEEWNYEVMSEDLHELIKHQQIEHPVLIGHSMGGKVAMFFAGKYPDQALSKLVIVDIAPKAYPIHHDQILDALLSLDLSQINARREADQALAKYLDEPGVRQFLLKNLDRDEENRFRWKVNLPVIHEKIDMVGEPFPENLKYEGPTLFIKGARSAYIQEGDEALIQTYFPQARLQTVSEAGHWVHAEQPQAFLELLMDFLNQ